MQLCLGGCRAALGAAGLSHSASSVLHPLCPPAAAVAGTGGSCPCTFFALSYGRLEGFGWATWAGKGGRVAVFVSGVIGTWGCEGGPAGAPVSHRLGPSWLPLLGIPMQSIPESSWCLSKCMPAARACSLPEPNLPVPGWSIGVCCGDPWHCPQRYGKVRDLVTPGMGHMGGGDAGRREGLAGAGCERGDTNWATAVAPRQRLAAAVGSTPAFTSCSVCPGFCSLWFNKSLQKDEWEPAGCASSWAGGDHGGPAVRVGAWW